MSLQTLASAGLRARKLPDCGFWPSQAGLDPDRPVAGDVSQPAVLPSSSEIEFSAPIRVFRSSIARPTDTLSRLRLTPRDARRKTRGQDGFAPSFLVGFFHSLKHAGLARRTSGNPVFRPNQGRRNSRAASHSD